MSEQSAQGIIHHSSSDRPTDYLYRISIKCLVRNIHGEVLVVKEGSRDYWDLPGGGMDHNEDIKTAIAREMKEEVNLSGEFEHRIIAVEDPKYSDLNDFWQMRLIFELKPEDMSFRAGEDGDEVAFMNPESLKDSDSETERRIYQYANVTTG